MSWVGVGVTGPSTHGYITLPQLMLLPCEQVCMFGKNNPCFGIAYNTSENPKNRTTVISRFETANNSAAFLTTIIRRFYDTIVTYYSMRTNLLGG
jgi:hypothetical protein